MPAKPAAAPVVVQPISIPGAWPFPMANRS
jgi:hypothetical protein